MERHHNAGHKNARVICWLISLLVLVASPSLVQAAISCGKCHGGGDGTPVNDAPLGARSVGTIGSAGTGGQFKGNHTTHLAAAPTAVHCTVCHGANVATYGSTHSAINKNQIQMAAKLDGYSGLKRARYGTTLFWNLTSVPQLKTCSNVNCHFERITDVWGSPAYSLGDVATCSKCHDALPTTASHGKHITAYGGGLNSCGKCHTDYSTAASANLKFQHATSAGRAIKVTVGYTPVDSNYLPGKLALGRNFSTCATTYCHSSGQSLTSGTVATPAYVTNNFGTTGTTCASAICHPTSRAATISGSHTKHLADVSVQCANCHTGVSTDGATYAFGGTHNNNLIDVAASLGYTAGGAPGNGYSSCSTASCHDNGTGVAAAPPAWGAIGSPACSVCHQQYPTTGKHTKHSTAGAFRAFDCGECHNGSVALTNAGPRHLNGFVNISSTFGYPSSIAKHLPPYTGSCSTTYCHSAGQSLTNGTVATPTFATTPPTWNTASTATCGSCHPASPAATVSASHGKHLTSTVKVMGCNDCHDNVAANGTSYANSTLHINRSIDVTAGLGYDKGGAPGNGYGTCANGSCHNDGTLSATRSVQWGTTKAACTACHGGFVTTAGTQIATGAHNKHLALDGAKFSGGSIACGSCHVGANATTGGPAHFDGGINVDTTLGYPASIAKHAVGNYTGNNCTTSYCHADAGSNAAYNTIRTFKSVNWGDTSTGCNFCHPLANLSGTHAKHAGRINLASITRSYANYTANASNGQEGAGGSYGFGCATCHPTAVTNHINGTIEVTFVADAAAGSMRAKNVGATLNGSLGNGTVTCTATYCHGTGLANSGTTPAWNGAFAGDRCANCHGNLPTTGAHGAHKVGIHYNNIFSGTSGFLGYSSTGNVAHGQSVQATTISCNICHALTVSTGFNKGSNSCSTSTCHAKARDNTRLALVDAPQGFQYHVNGKVDVSFKDINITSKAQIRETSFSVYSGIWTRNGGVSNYKKDATSYDVAKKSLSTSLWTAGTPGQSSCANVACHNQRTGQSVIWNQSLQCVDCHSEL